MLRKLAAGPRHRIEPHVRGSTTAVVPIIRIHSARTTPCPALLAVNALDDTGETHELRQELNSPNRDKKKDAVKKVRAWQDGHTHTREEYQNTLQR